MGKVLLIGKTGVGKTTLIQVLKEQVIRYKKTQATEYHDHIIDIPGEYIENPRLYSAIITLGCDSDLIVLIHPVGDEAVYFPPHFGEMFRAKVIGIVSKIDLAKDQTDIDQVARALKGAGASEIYAISAIKGDGMCEIKRMLYA